MRAIVDLLENKIVSWGRLYDSPEFLGITFDIPNDYNPLFYEYIPSQPGVFDPNGFVLKPQGFSQEDIDKREGNLNDMNSYMSTFINNGITQANFDLFLSDTAALQQQYKAGGSRLITWIETVNRNGYNASTNGFKTRTAYRGLSSNDVNGASGEYIRANTILEFLNNL